MKVKKLSPKESSDKANSILKKMGHKDLPLDKNQVLVRFLTDNMLAKIEGHELYLWTGAKYEHWSNVYG